MVSRFKKVYFLKALTIKQLNLPTILSDTNMIVFKVIELKAHTRELK